jgi:fucose permease
MPNTTTRLTAASYLSMLFLGVGGALIGAAARNIGLTPFQIGLFLAVQNIGFMFGVAVAGTLADRHEKPRILLAGSLILALAFALFYQTDLFWLNLIIMALIGTGSGTFEGVTDPLLLELHPERQGLHINVNHFFVTLGSILITVYLIFLEMNWRVSLVQSAAVVLLLAGVYALSRRPAGRDGSDSFRDRLRLLAGDRLVISLFAATVLVVGVELGTTGILTTYLMEHQGFNQTTSKLGLIVFLSGIAIGRLIVGYLSRTERLEQTLLALFGAAVFFFTILYFAGLGQWTYVSVFLAGMAMSALFPLMITLAGQAYPEMAGTVIGAIKVAIPIGGIVLPFAMSLASSAASLPVALAIYPLALLLALGLLAAVLRRRPVDVPS